jgi:hypothetical protein
MERYSVKLQTTRDKRPPELKNRDKRPPESYGEILSKTTDH